MAHDAESTLVVSPSKRTGSYQLSTINYLDKYFVMINDQRSSIAVRAKRRIGA
jgi:hypothetical protein